MPSRPRTRAAGLGSRVDLILDGGPCRIGVESTGILLAEGCAVLLRPGGLFVVVDWGNLERPVGPPLDHVLGLSAVRDVIREMGLEEIEAHEPGTELPYHLVVVAAKR